MHILLVEDHDDTRKAMGMFLRAHGHRTQVAAGVQEALDLAAKSDTRFDLLLSDLRLTDGTGWNLFTALEGGGHAAAASRRHKWMGQRDRCG